jgi:hypothetical protein
MRSSALSITTFIGHDSTHNNLVRSEEPQVYKESVRKVETEVPTEISTNATGKAWAFLTMKK